MPQFEVQQEYAHAAEKVWAMTSDFGGLQNWLPGIQACRVEGSGAADAGGNAVRVIDVFDGSVTRERLESFDATTMRYQYALLEAKGLDERNAYLATFRITPLGLGRCRVNWGASFRVPDDVPPEKAERMAQRFTQMYGMCLQHLEGVLARGG